MHNVDDLYPLTPTQAGMLFQCLRDEDPALYFEQVRVDLVGSIEPAEIRQAFETVVRRHPALRSVIVWEGLEAPLQAVRGEVALPFEVLDFADCDEADLELIAAERRTVGFDLTVAPLHRVAIVDRGQGRQHLIWEFHHILCDGWSAVMVLDEVLRVCNGASLSENPPAFRDYLAWLKAQDVEATAAYWKQVLDGFVTPTPLSLPRASSDEEFHGAQHVEWIAGDEFEALRRFASESRVTLNSLVQAAWSCLQSFYSGSDDVVFGVTTSGRPADLPEVHSIVGMFLNTLPMRVSVTPSLPLSQFIGAVQEQQLQSGEHASASLAELQRQVGLGVGQDLFDTVLIFENYPTPAEVLSNPRLSLESKSVFEQTNYPLTLMVGVEGGLKMVANFDENRFEAAAIARLMSQFAEVLKGMPSAESVGDLPILTREDEALLASWQGRPMPLGLADTVSSRLVWRAQQHPDAVALIDGPATMTFGELVASGQALADELQRGGVGPEVAVGVALPRSIDMVVAMVGTLLAGGAYVPLDPRFPNARLRLMMEASGAPVVLTSTDHRSAIPTIDGIDYVLLDGSVDSRSLTDAQVGMDHVDRSTPDSTMLLTFTSGSTGVPKGVKVHHTGVLNRCEWQWAEFPIQPGEVVPHKTTLGFVDHLWEVWGGLLGGATVLLIDDDVVTDPDALIDVLAANDVRRISMVPSLLDLILDHEPSLAQRLPHLSMWSVSGEALSQTTARRFSRILPDATLINLYGMSEASQDATFAVVDPRSNDPVIGRPIANMRVLLLDPHDRPVPIGVPGQIHVAGPGLSTGYWRRPDLTAERFVAVPDPLSFMDPGDRMYRSGDIGRWRGDGMLEYLGRTDHQVKVRGVRVELGEVEAALGSHPGISRSVVVGHPGAGGVELVGYVVSEDDGVDPADLRAHAQARLPEVMVPGRIVALRDFPLLPNGKVNRAALPAPGSLERAPSSQVHELSDDEQRMLEVWRAVMDQPYLSPDDNFFDAGGHSMLAMRLVSRIKNDLGVSIGLSQLLRTGTVRDLSAALMHEKGAEGATSTSALRHVVPILEAQPDLPNLIIVHGAGGDVLNFRRMAHLFAGRLNVVGIQAAGVDGIAAMHESREQMIRAYLEEITAYQPQGPYLLAGFSIGGLIAVELAERLRASGASVQSIILFDTFHPSLTPRSIPRSEHLRKLIRDPRYGIERLQGKLRTRREDSERQRWLSTDSDGPVPFEVRKWQITNNSIELWRDYSPPAIEVPVLMVSAAENADIWDGIPADRGWSKSAAAIRLVRVPGDHMTLVEDPNVAALASKLGPILVSDPAEVLRHA